MKLGKLCKKCGKAIHYVHTCPYCGTVQFAYVPDNFGKRTTLALALLDLDAKYQSIMVALNSINLDHRRNMTDLEAISLDAKESELVSQAAKREHELGIKSHNGFRYI